jgi:hypothetical protein
MENKPDPLIDSSPDKEYDRQARTDPVAPGFSSTQTLTGQRWGGSLSGPPLRRSIAPMPNKTTIHVSPDWLPTPEAINALPEPLRRYIMELETNTDPAGMVRENALLRAQRDAIVVKLAELRERSSPRRK